MKKTSDRHNRRLPVSQKAYNRFRERILRVNDLFGLDSSYMLWLFEEYMEGRTHDISEGGLACDLAFEMLRVDIDAAIARSARARRNARLRRERKERERQEQQKCQPEERQADTSPADTDHSRERPVPVFPPVPSAFVSPHSGVSAAMRVAHIGILPMCEPRAAGDAIGPKCNL